MRKIVHFGLWLSFLFLPGLLWPQPGRGKVRKGNALFKQEKYEAAANQYQDALLENPNSLHVQFNMGDVEYKKKNYEKALDFYQKVLKTEDPQLQANTYYNIGNTLYRMGKLPESILAYQEALKRNPNDQDAKYNLEFVRNKLKENAQPQAGAPSQSQQEQKESSSQQKPEDQKNQKKEEQNEQEEQPETAPQSQQKQMSKEQAEQILNALEEKQKNQKQRQVRISGRPYVEKDW